MPSLKEALRAAAHRLGYEIHRADLGSSARRHRAMEMRSITHVLDVGANIGQYAEALRSGGFQGLIDSFEPLPEAYGSLAGRMAGDPHWRGHQIALGSAEETAVLHVSPSNVLSSLLNATPTLEANIPAARSVVDIEVQVRRLDNLWSALIGPADKVLLKIDTQGFEHSVLDGAPESLASVDLIEVEASLTPTYEGGSSIHDVLPRLRDSGFEVVSIDCYGGFINPTTGQVLDVNILAGRPVSA